MYKRILLPTDGSEVTAKAVKTAIALARLTGAPLTATLSSVGRVVSGEKASRSIASGRA